MKILYICRRPSGGNGLYHRARRCLYMPLVGGDGFFEASLFQSFPSTRVVYADQAEAMCEAVLNRFDWIIVNRKAVKGGQFKRTNGLDWLDKLSKPQKALFVNNDDEHSLPEARLLERFDVIFKRERLADRRQYQLDYALADRLHTTMLSCPLWTATRLFRRRIFVHKYTLPARNVDPFDWDVSFVGADSNPLRREVLRTLGNLEFRFSGGLFRLDDKCLPLNWDGPGVGLMRPDAYRELIASSKVNLALDGHGGFTHRHLELWCMGAFMLSSPAIRDITLPCDEQPRDGVHYVSFASIDDMVDKIRYYSQHDQERRKIAEAGRRYFEKLYDFKAHGSAIRKILESACRQN